MRWSKYTYLLFCKSDRKVLTKNHLFCFDGKYSFTIWITKHGFTVFKIKHFFLFWQKTHYYYGFFFAETQFQTVLENKFFILFEMQILLILTLCSFWWVVDSVLWWSSINLGCVWYKWQSLSSTRNMRILSTNINCFLVTMVTNLPPLS